jgi:serine-type D-Ala-D-Ala carboxypeptidase/endopeptidase (penicillin-binding protein 4)
MPLARRLVLLVAASAAVAAPAGASPVPLATQLTRALTVPHVSLASSAAAVVDLETGAPVYAHNGSLPLAPASNEKLVVTYAALTDLGPAFRFETDALGDGAQDGAVWRGDVVLKGYGDPTLTSVELASLAQQVRAEGITRVTGSVVGDESWFDARRTAPGWKASFFIEESPPLSALVVDRSRYGASVSRQPALAAALLFRTALRRAGVSVTGAATVGVAASDDETLGSVESPPLATIVRWMDLESDNFTAEMLLKELGAVDAGTGSTAAGATTARSLLADAGIPLAGVRIVDGSGLSLLDRLTPNTLVALLAEMWNDPDLRPNLVRALPVAGISGTLADRMRRAPARGRVRAKTGTTSIASALSGYAGDRYVFAVLQNGHPLPFWWARRAQDRFATVLASAAG